MTWEITAEVDRFDEAVDYFRARVPVGREDVDFLDPQERARAWTVVGAMEIEVAKTVHASIADAAESGIPFEQWRKETLSKIEGWRPSEHHLETIFRTNVQTAYNTGRYYQITDPDISRIRPYLIFDAVLDSRTTPICRERDGTIKPQGDPYIDANWPPLHHRCRSGWAALMEDEAEELGGVTPGEPGPPIVQPRRGGSFGESPPVRAKSGGWPGPDRENYGADLWDAYEGRKAAFEVADTETREQDAARTTALVESSWEHWYETTTRAQYGDEAGKVVAWGRAMEARGRALTADEAASEWARLRAAGVKMPDRLGKNPIEAARTLVGDAADDAARIRGGATTMGDLVDAADASDAGLLSSQLRTTAALTGHARTVRGGKVAIQRRRPKGKRMPSPSPEKHAYPQATAFFETMGDRTVLHPVDHEIVWHKARAYYIMPHRDFRGQIAAGDLRSLVHEWGHGIENVDPVVSRRALAFLKARTDGEQVRRLRDILPRHGYKAHEKAIPDHFINPYVGKQYPARSQHAIDPGHRDTEVTSMGLEYLSDPATSVALYEADPDHFFFALGVLAGKLLP